MLLGVSRQSVTKWEAEKSYPEMDKLLKLCQIFDCSLDDLVQGDLAGRAVTPDAPVVPDGPPQDICGYDEHQRMLAWRIPMGIVAIVVGIAIGFLFEDAAPAGMEEGSLFVMIVLAGVLVGLAFLIPAGVEHSAFVREHPYIEDFYTAEERARARVLFCYGVVGGIAAIFVGVGLLFFFEPWAENYALFFLLLFIALGVWSIIRYGMLLGRTNVAQYNKSAAEDLEVEDIMAATLEDEVKSQMLDRKRRDSKLSAICAAIMIVATIVGLALLFAPVLSAPDPDNFEPLGTSAAWFWVAWPVGGLLCGLVSVLWNGFHGES